ncbi:substrate-binding domain-containing protein [Psychrilyobacter atlanticus]|uniref:substrate-binding domain-containing protein n=1 Tax=Psychrilyobacter atlanticus TaxID=271091 RepID=UPI0004054522|nr:substrate-binding domain-containing protein [Psychrilyobacter atlanticus]
MKKIIFTLMLLISLTSFGASDQLLLATTTSVRDSGLLDYILPEFEKETGIDVKFVAVGTGRALKMGEDGEVDALLVHAKTSELKFIKAGHGIDRVQFMHNFFIVVGPEDGNKFKNLNDALNKIDKNKYKFVSRGDDSGTNKKEISLWKNENINTDKDWYMSSGNGMAATLKIASEKGCYTLTDMSTYLHLKDKLNLDIKVNNDQNLINEYSVITINPDKNKMINYKNAKIFMNWITSKETKKLISTYGVEEFKMPLFIVE